jgi:phage gp29-like protein
MGPRQKYPRLRIVVEDESDAVQIANAVALLADAGLKIAAEDVRTKVGLRTPADGEEVLAKPTSATGQPVPLPTPSLKASSALPPRNLAVNAAMADAAAQETDSIDALIEEQLADWEVMIKPMMSPIAKLAKSCNSSEEFLAKLPSMIPAMKVDAFAEALAKAMFSARLAGQTDADLGSGGHGGV